MRLVRTAILALLLFAAALVAAPAAADDWVAVKLRGSVFTYIDDAWVKLERGEAIPDNRVVRTQRSGHVLFQRAAETIELGPNTQISIADHNGRRYTTVKQWYGKVSVQAEVRNIEHFEVQTPHLAATVKGTRFVVLTGKASSKVTVQRGQVEVESRSGGVVVLAAGQAAETGGAQLVLSGKGGKGGGTLLPSGAAPRTKGAPAAANGAAVGIGVPGSPVAGNGPAPAVPGIGVNVSPGNIGVTGPGNQPAPTGGVSLPGLPGDLTVQGGAGPVSVQLNSGSTHTSVNLGDGDTAVGVASPAANTSINVDSSGGSTGASVTVETPASLGATVGADVDRDDPAVSVTLDSHVGEVSATLPLGGVTGPLGF